MLKLFTNPTKFFADEKNYQGLAIPLVGAYVVGIVAASGQIDNKLLISELRQKTNSTVDTLSQGWTPFWTILLVSGLMYAALYWFLGSWWYGKRLKFSGANAPEVGRVRRTYVFQALVCAIPSLLIIESLPIRFPNYLVAWQAAETWQIVVEVAALLASCLISFIGATTAFEVSRKKALIWFLALPLLTYAARFALVFSMVKMVGRST